LKAIRTNPKMTIIPVMGFSTQEKNSGMIFYHQQIFRLVEEFDSEWQCTNIKE